MKYFTEQEKRQARYILNEAIRHGKVERPSICEACDGDTVPIHAHHPDYSEPLTVAWLCRDCHRALHRAIYEMDSMPLYDLSTIFPA